MFKLTIPIAQTYVQKSHDSLGNEVERKFITGVASGTELDRDTEKMAETALHAMRKSIDEGIIDENGEVIQVPLYSEHRKETLEQLGWLTKAWIQKSETTNEHQLWVEAELDEDNPKASLLYKKLTTPNPNKGRPVQLGLSISGKVLSAFKQFDPAIKKAVTVFEQIALSEVSVVTKPAYIGSYLDILEKSYKDDTGNDLPVRGESSMTDLTNSAEAQVTETPSDDTEKSSVTDTQEQEVISDATEKATPSDSSDELEKALTSRFEGIEKQIADMMKAIENLARIPEAQETENKSATETQDDVQKDDTDVDPVNVLKGALTDALKSELAPVLSKMAELEQNMEQLGKPVDKSFSVLGGDGNDNPTSVYEARKSAAVAEGRPFDPIAEGIRAWRSALERS